MANYIFGYGSLMIPCSISKTLGRKISLNALKLVKLENYVRIWNVVISVSVNSNDIINAVFLNILLKFYG